MRIVKLHFVRWMEVTVLDGVVIGNVCVTERSGAEDLR